MLVHMMVRLGTLSRGANTMCVDQAAGAYETSPSP